MNSRKGLVLALGVALSEKRLIGELRHSALAQRHKRTDDNRRLLYPAMRFDAMACVLPAHRASTVDPMKALHHE
jgi:hypothetical protein